MKKLNPEFYIDDLRLFKHRKSNKSGIHFFHLTGMYYFAVFLLKKLNYPLPLWPHRSEGAFYRAIQLYMSSPTEANIDSIELVLRCLKTDHEIISKPKYTKYYQFYVYIKKDKDINDLGLILLQSTTWFGKIMNKLTINTKKMKQIVHNEFELSDKIPPLEQLYYKLIDLLL